MAEHLSKNQIKWVRSLQQKKQRDAEGVFVAEGHKCVEELRGAFDLLLLVTPDNATEMEIAQMSNLRTPQGVIGVFKRRGDEAKGERREARGERTLCWSIMLESAYEFEALYRESMEWVMRKTER